MRAINHAVTGALLGLSIGKPLLALPVALLSHFVLDVIPHHGAEKSKIKAYMLSTTFKWLLVIDAALCGLLVLVLALRSPLHWQLAAVCAFLGAAPDFFSFSRFWNALHKKPWQPGMYARFASWIQWFERPIGAIVEVLWLAGGLVLLWPFLR